MSQSSFIAGMLLAGFLLYLAANDRLSLYAAVLWGKTKAPLPSDGGNSSPIPLPMPGAPAAPMPWWQELLLEAPKAPALPGAGGAGGLLESLPLLLEFLP